MTAAAKLKRCVKIISKLKELWLGRALNYNLGLNDFKPEALVSVDR